MEPVMERAKGGRAQMVLAFEVTCATPPGNGFTCMPFASTTLGAEQPLLASELLDYGRVPLVPTRGVMAPDGNIVGPVVDHTLVIQTINREACTLEFDYALADGISLNLTAHTFYLPRLRVEITVP